MQRCGIDVAESGNSQEAWDTFSALVASTPPGNNRRLCFFTAANDEICPPITLPLQPGAADGGAKGIGEGLVKLDDMTDAPQEIVTLLPLPDNAVRCRGVLENRAVAMAAHAQQFGVGALKRIKVIGGGARNTEYLHIIANALGAQVLVPGESGDVAAAGSVLRCGGRLQATDPSQDFTVAPRLDHARVYKELISAYSRTEPLLIARYGRC
jgi:sugar (pentulose or hexulose) kinase